MKADEMCSGSAENIKKSFGKVFFWNLNHQELNTRVTETSALCYLAKTQNITVQYHHVCWSSF